MHKHVTTINQINHGGFATMTSSGLRFVFGKSFARMASKIMALP
jgi:hypothetical protein